MISDTIINFIWFAIPHYVFLRFICLRIYLRSWLEKSVRYLKNDLIFWGRPDTIKYDKTCSCKTNFWGRFPPSSVLIITIISIHFVFRMYCVSSESWCWMIASDPVSVTPVLPPSFVSVDWFRVWCNLLVVSQFHVENTSWSISRPPKHHYRLQDIVRRLHLWLSLFGNILRLAFHPVSSSNFSACIWFILEGWSPVSHVTNKSSPITV